MSRRSTLPSRRIAPILAAVIASAALLAIGPAQPAQAATDRLPDLRMAKLSDFRIVTTSGGRRLLRFTSMMTNLGAGPFVVRSARRSSASPWRVQQQIVNTAGGSRRMTVGASMLYGGDGHGHWHVRRMVDVDFWAGGPHRRGAKVGFCFFDTTIVNRRLPRAPRGPVYRESGCARRSALSSVMGISVGWGDKYRWSLPFQWLDITGIPDGQYRIRAVVDPQNFFRESSNDNNCTYTRLQITGRTVRVLGSGSVCINDYALEPFADDIRWAMASGVMPGCGVDLFCPAHGVVRSQAAGAIDRAIAPPATTTDFYDDDNGLPEEAAINRLAAAGHLTACGSRQFCPGVPITRAGLASMIARAFALPPPTSDPFVDDEGDPDEDAINQVAERGIMTACTAGPDSFCPSAGLNRAELAAFLHRAVGH